MNWFEEKALLDQMLTNLTDIEIELRNTADEQRQNELRSVYRSLLLKIEDQELKMRGISDE